tara:strand:+ start:580 stop:882 length:303 start_codon:yes stop_codon:yes gene_type:complete
MNNKIIIQNEIVEFPISKMGSLDIESIDIVIKAYKKFAEGEYIEFSGFNDMSGYVYICLSNGVQIISNFGQKVEFLIYDNETEEEIFFDTYEQAENKLNN